MDSNMGLVVEKPLISFIVLAYNQERFIREAVEGAFAQTYSPLEIIISDDCSTDRTFEIIEEMSAGYSGSHKVIINRNEKNLGIGQHVNLLMEISSGEIIVAAAGDDISKPERTETIYDIFNKSNNNVQLVFSDYQMIDEDGEKGAVVSSLDKIAYDYNNPIELCNNYFRNASGASCAWRRTIYDTFGPMLSEVCFEDSVHFFRSALLGTIQHISKPLVFYRRHNANICEMFRSEEISDHKWRLNCTKDVYKNNIRDLEHFSVSNRGSHKIVRQCHRVMRKRIRMLDARMSILSGEPLKTSCGLFKLVINGGHPFRGLQLVVKVIRSG